MVNYQGIWFMKDNKRQYFCTGRRYVFSLTLVSPFSIIAFGVCFEWQSVGEAIGRDLFFLHWSRPFRCYLLEFASWVTKWLKQLEWNHCSSKILKGGGVIIFCYLHPLKCLTLDLFQGFWGYVIPRNSFSTLVHFCCL